MNEHELKENIALFKTEKQNLIFHAAQCAAMQIIAHMDMEKIIISSVTEQESAIKKLRRLIERERLKGNAAHWSYDLNRHIALKQAFDRLINIVKQQKLSMTTQ